MKYKDKIPSINLEIVMQPITPGIRKLDKSWMFEVDPTIGYDEVAKAFAEELQKEISVG